jgi:hypothetical protein
MFALKANGSVLSPMPVSNQVLEKFSVSGDKRDKTGWTKPPGAVVKSLPKIIRAADTLVSLRHKLRPERLLPIGDGVDFFLFEKSLRDSLRE